MYNKLNGSSVTYDVSLCNVSYFYCDRVDALF